MENPVHEEAGGETFDVEEEPAEKPSKKKKKKGKKKGKGKKGSGKVDKEHRLANKDDRNRETEFGEVSWTNEPRKCQDCFFLLVMLCYWVAMGIFKHASDHGDWKRLLLPEDLDGKTCGMGDFKDCPQLYFANPLADPKDRRCVANCPSKSGELVCDCGYCEFQPRVPSSSASQRGLNAWLGVAFQAMV